MFSWNPNFRSCRNKDKICRHETLVVEINRVSVVRTAKNPMSLFLSPDLPERFKWPEAGRSRSATDFTRYVYLLMVIVSWDSKKYQSVSQLSHAVVLVTIYWNWGSGQAPSPWSDDTNVMGLNTGLASLVNDWAMWNWPLRRWPILWRGMVATARLYDLDYRNLRYVGNGWDTI